MEAETEGKLAFLDLLIGKTGGQLTSSIFRKPTFSGLGTSFFSYCHINFKLNSIKTLLHRAYTLSSNYQYFHDEVIFLRKYFYNNGYSTQYNYSIKLLTSS